MRKLLVLVSALAVAACSAGNAQRAEGDSGSRAQASRDFQAGAFDRIQLTGSPDLVVTVGGQPSIRAEGDAEMLERLEIVAENGQLRIAFAKAPETGSAAIGASPSMSPCPLWPAPPPPARATSPSTAFRASASPRP